MADTIISLQGVTKEFDTKGGQVVALKDINLDIEKGDSYGIIGLSGAGKSTLVRTINLLEQPTEGKVLFDGQVLTGSFCSCSGVTPADFRPPSSSSFFGLWLKFSNGMLVLFFSLES